MRIPEDKAVLVELARLLEEKIFHPDYINLCRQKPLNRVFTQGDWYVIFDRFDGGEVLKGPKCWGPYRHSHRTLASGSTEIVWLPRLDQIFAMLDSRDPVFVQFETDTQRGTSWSFAMHPISPRTHGMSREEAAYRMLTNLSGI